MDKVNIKGLAKELNLAISTVSRALRDSYEISPETKHRVVTLAKKLNYQPNPYATSLRNQKSRTIGVVIPEIANNFFSLAIKGIQEVAQQKGYHVLIYLTHEDYKKEVSIASHLAYGRVDGILVSISSETNDIAHLEELNNNKIPIVFFDRISEKINTTKVTTDDYKSGYSGTEHLIQKGCKKISFLSISEHLSIGVKRMQGYIDALKDNNIPVEERLILKASNDNEENYKNISKLLKSTGRPDGIFASVEKLAISTYHVCAALGLSIPGDVKVLGFSNLETASLLNPSLTTITQPAFEIGKEAATILFEGLSRKIVHPGNKHIIVHSELIERASTR